MAEAPACAVCGRPATESTSAVCNSCGRRYHLHMRNDQDGPECGEVWINEQYLSLEFACRDCLDETRGAPPRPRRLSPRTGRRRYRRRA